jgi:hypothetical protein
MRGKIERVTDIKALIQRGYIDADEDIIFYRHSDACNCFGHTYKQYMPALARHPFQDGVTIWFPRFFPNDKWDNTFDDSENTVYEKRKHDNASYIDECLGEPDKFNRLLFAKVKEPSGEFVYRFKGRYEIDPETSREKSAITYRRKTKRVDTFHS